MKIRGTASQVYEKYLQLARDSGSSGDRVQAENYLQHAEHYYRIMMAAQANQNAQAAQGAANGSGNNSNSNSNGGTDSKAANGGEGNGSSAPSFSLSENAEDEEAA